MTKLRDRTKETSRTAAHGTEFNARFEHELISNLITEWDQAGQNYKGEELLRKQWDIEKRAIILGPGDPLLRFFDFLKSQGANDTRERVISEIGNAIFSGKDAGEARQWLLGIQNLEVRQRLCELAGKHHPKEGIKEYIRAFDPDAKCQSAVLTGYCRNIAKTDPLGAVQAFSELRPSNVTFGGIAEIMAVLPPESDFAAISSTLPGDTKNIAKRARAALLQSWTAAKPEAAAQYVIANTTLASPEQMGVVVSAWCKQSPETAAGWIDCLSQSPIKDEGTSAMAKYWISRNPIKAWEFAAKLGDFNKKLETATAVFKEWEKTDRAAAEAAWVALFPGK